MKNLVRKLVLTVAALTSPAAFAHHGWSDYDADQPMTLQGRIDASSYENPHATIKLAAGGRLYDVVLAPVSRMESRGAPRESVAVGRSVTVVGYPSKTHPGEVRAERLTIGDDHGQRTIELR